MMELVRGGFVRDEGVIRGSCSICLLSRLRGCWSEGAFDFEIFALDNSEGARPRDGNLVGTRPVREAWGGKSALLSVRLPYTFLRIPDNIS